MNYLGPGRYRHYKGGEYEVLGLALRENSIRKPGEPVYGISGEVSVETPEDGGPGEVFVVYRPLTPGSLLEKRQEDFWAREFRDFNAVLGAGLARPASDDEGTRYPRFQFERSTEKRFSETQISNALRELERLMKDDQATTVWALFTILGRRDVRTN